MCIISNNNVVCSAVAGQRLRDKQIYMSNGFANMFPRQNYTITMMDGVFCVVRVVVL
jgi:hypothetical protein